ncbi:MAG: diacylglycerol kinase family lipid kinase [Deltaproteobacteria bacterium]|jgi:YegS/Rv2252/BmrU family lipid kinase|nr:diacylglycerol kinase family lipid kinase [Deltaproteobacteria bacterium]MBW2542411.1 diacylglycerol kinase family lipid kinase [Deltaproteobacteria bacterium]
MPVRTLVIANPKSRNRATARRLKSLEAKLRHALGPLDFECTRAPRDAERIAREGVRSGVERLVVAGGDGTLSEVVTGLLSAGLGDYAAVGLLPVGTAGDFARGLGESRDLDAAIDRIADGKTLRVDAGRATYCCDDREGVTSYFANIASLGLSGDVAEWVNRAGKGFGGRLSYLLGALRGLARYRSEPVSISVDGESVFEGALAAAAIANGPRFGGGMQIAPNARVDDGVFDWVIVPAMSRLSLLRKIPLLYSGSHLRDSRILHGRGKRVEARAMNGPVRIDVDGEALGALPARFEILPGAITLLGFEP